MPFYGFHSASVLSFQQPLLLPLVHSTHHIYATLKSNRSRSFHLFALVVISSNSRHTAHYRSFFFSLLLSEHFCRFVVCVCVCGEGGGRGGVGFTISLGSDSIYCLQVVDSILMCVLCTVPHPNDKRRKRTILCVFIGSQSNRKVAHTHFLSCNIELLCPFLHVLPLFLHLSLSFLLSFLLFFLLSFIRSLRYVFCAFHLWLMALESYNSSSLCCAI